VYEIGTDARGVFVALEAGRLTLEQWSASGSFERLLVMFDEALAGLAAVRNAGLVHGAIDGRGVIVSRDGRAKLSRFTLLGADAPPVGDPHEDAVALCRAFRPGAEQLRAPPWFLALVRRDEVSLEAVREALKRSSRARPRWASRALVAAVGLATAAVAWKDSMDHGIESASTCSDDAEAVAEAWGQARKTAVETSVLGSGREGAAGKWQELEGRFDRWVEAWTRVRQQTCEAVARADVELAERKATNACLEDRLMQLEILSDGFATATDESVGALFGKSRTLPRPEDCVDNPSYRKVLSDAGREVINDVARAHALMLAQRTEESRAIYSRAAPQAESMGLFNVASEAYRFVALEAQDGGDPVLAETLLKKALFTAEQSREPVMVVRAWHRLAEQARRTRDPRLTEFFMARALARAEDAAVAEETRLELLTYEAERLRSLDRPAEAAKRYVEAYEYIRVYGNQPLQGLQALLQASQATATTGDRAAADALAKRVVEEGSARYGAHHWIVAISQAQLAQAALVAKDSDEGLRWSTQALEVELDHPMAFQAKGMAVLMHADLLRESGRVEEGRTLLSEALVELEPRLRAWPLLLTAIRTGLARFSTELGRPCEAADASGPIVAQIEANPLFSRANYATELLNLANAQSLCGRVEEGLASLERGLAVTASLEDTAPRYRFDQHKRAGTIYKQLGRPARALERYEHALMLADAVDVAPERLEWIRSEIRSLRGAR